MARRRLFSDEHWAGLFALPADERAIVRHCTLAPDDLALIGAKRSARNRLGYALLLCALRHPGRALGVGETPPAAMVAYVARQLGLSPAALGTCPGRPQTRREQLGELMRHGGFGSFGRAEGRALVAWLALVAQTDRSPARLAGMLIDELRRRRILLPTPRVLELVIHHARARAERVTHRALLEGMAPEQADALDRLLVPSPERGGASALAWLRQAPGAPTARNLVRLVERVRVVRQLGLDRGREGAVPPAAFDALAGEGLRMTAQHLRDLAQPRRAATVAAAMLRLEAELTDAALLMFDKLMGGLSRRAERLTADRAAGALRDAREQLRLLARAGRAVIAAHEAETDPVAAVEEAVGWSRFLRAVLEAEGLARPETVDPRAELVRRWPAARLFAPALLEAFTFEGTAGASALLKAVALLREMNRTGKRALPGTAPTGFIRRAWRPFVLEGGKPDRRAWEVCVLSELRDRLRAGDVWVRGSRRYRNFEDCLLPRSSFAALRAEGPLPVAVPEDAGQFLAAKREALATAFADVAAAARAGRLPDVTLDEEGLRIAPLRAEEPPEARRLAGAAYDLLPRVKITDLLLEVDGWAGFSACFTHQRSGRPAEDRAALLTAVLADGINLGLTRMAEACRGATLRQLAWTHDWHVREECYAAALARLIEAHRALPLARAWGEGTTSSSDGQFFRAGGRGEALGDINARHGSEPGVAFYTHVSDQFGPFHTKVIAATASEAPHVLDGLLRHRTGLPIAEHYTDTGGATDQVFGLLHLLGFRFAPRLRDLKDRRLYAFRGQAVPDPLAGLVGGAIDAEHVRAHWGELLRLAVSVRSGHASASGMLRRLAAYPRQNGLAVALREVGRIERTLFTLDWLKDPDLRRRANAGLNKGEARNALARAVFFHRLGELRDRSFENQAYRASGLNLLVAAIILWNTRYLQAALEALASRGVPTPPELLRHVAPLGWEHISLTGDYVWPEAAQPAPGTLRPLRDSTSLLAA